MVDWKKDISLGRKQPSEDTPAAKPASTPFWKKEIGRKKSSAEDAPQPEAGTTSVFKREDGDATPFWKKEIAIGRRRGPAAPAAETRAKPEDAVPFWKKEIAIGRRRKPVVTGPDPEEVALAAFVTPPVVEVELPVDVEPEPELVAEPEPIAAVDPDDEYGWLTAPTEAADEPARSWVELVEEAPEPPVAEVAEADAEPMPASVALPPEEPQPEAMPVSIAPPEREPEPEIPAVVAVPPPVPAALPGIHPPVPAAELPPLPEENAAQEKKPFYKRDLSFGRKPKSERAPKQPKERKQKKEKAAAGTPFWKRDLSVGRSKASDEEPKPKSQPKSKGPKRVKRDKRAKNKKVVGLKVGASQIAAARVVNNGAAQLVQVAREQLAPGIVVGGELRDPDALAEALKLFFKKHKLPKRGVRLGIANNRIGVRSFDLEGIDDPKQLANAIRFRAQEALPIPIEEAVLDYHVLGASPDAEGNLVRRILLVVAYRELIDRYVDACRKAGIRLVGIDLEAFALLRALDAPREESDAPPEAATVAVAVGYDRSTFAVSDGRVCEFTRVLEWGGFAVNVAIARALDIAPSEAEPVKRGLSLAGGEVPEGLTAEQAEAARDAMRKQVGSFARELVSSLQFYQSQPGSLSIAGITLTGGTAHLPGLADELRRLIGVPVEIGDPLARVRVGKKVHTGEQVGSLAVAIGLGIED